MHFSLNLPERCCHPVVKNFRRLTVMPASASIYFKALRIFRFEQFFFVLSTQKKIDVIGIITRTRVRKWLKCLLSCILQFCHLYSRSCSFLLLFFFALSLPRSLAGWLVLFELVFVLFSIKGKYLLLVFYFDVAVAIVLLLVLCSSS